MIECISLGEVYSVTQPSPIKEPGIARMRIEQKKSDDTIKPLRFLKLFLFPMLMTAKKEITKVML
ncbi:MAG: hypothetical protein DCF19_03250 [Pseudanabaena frigida]|uniref:Uncharacterized protein n=1 Tax=Pseudanabaena frigida TaxID=945775 RepID=A0A2W4Y9W8_9CYAN|nr:MAG: hypothetical protein DCF19_03250 [Pseudanabaena frigida]